jgi:hypothetical protein
MSDDYVSPLAPAVSPLTQADPAAINEFVEQRVDAIFNKPPLSGITDDELMVMVRYYREKRQIFLTESAAKEAKGPTRRRTGPSPKSVAEALASTSDLL